MSKRVVSDAERASIMERFEERGGTLDGLPALVTGRHYDFARVFQRWHGNGPQVQAEYAWETLDRISRQDAPKARSW
jgi:hypothetical protein